VTDLLVTLARTYVAGMSTATESIKRNKQLHACALRIDRNLQRNRAVSLEEHGFFRLEIENIMCLFIADTEHWLDISPSEEHQGYAILRADADVVRRPAVYIVPFSDPPTPLRHNQAFCKSNSKQILQPCVIFKFNVYLFLSPLSLCCKSVLSSFPGVISARRYCDHSSLFVGWFVRS